MDEDEIIRELESKGALKRGHFQFASGRHGDTYIEKFAILQWPDTTAQLLSVIAQRFRGQANLAAGPTTGGVILSFDVARQLGIRSIIAERKEEGGEGREFRRGFEIGPGDKVLVVDDVLTTGGSINEVIQAVQGRNAEVIGVGVLVDRTGGKVDFKVPFQAALTINVVSWTPAECLLCKDNTPLILT